MQTIFAWGNQSSSWLTVLKICAVVVFALLTVRAIWKLTRYVNSSSGKTSADQYHWLMYPWKHPPMRSVTLWGLLTIGSVLFLFLFPSPEYDEDKVPSASNKGAVKQMNKTQPPTDLNTERQKREKETRKNNFKNVDSPGIHYKPPEIDPEKNINKILKRSMDRDKKEKK